MARSPEPATHAGGVVVRATGEQQEFLVVRARRSPHDWILPKGHIEAGESSEEAALREVREEAGVEAEILQRIGRNEFVAPDGPARVDYFLMRFLGEAEPHENRERRWCSYAEARACIEVPALRDVLKKARALLATPER
jgi:8-oxo-dGTP pyrophosphatase MutT (NUDIX family)